MSQEYVGRELDVFKRAENWKRYLASHIRLEGASSVLEVGAGLGGTTRLLCGGSQREWVCLEPDRRLAERLQASIDEGELPRACIAQVGTVASLAEAKRFDAVLYIDVLEHIAADAEELAAAARRLLPGGRLIVMSPAHSWLFSPFDAAIGHVRRYSRSSLAAAVPRHLRCETLLLLDSVGMMLSLANRILLRRAMPTERQVLFWDRKVVPVSRIVDRLLRYRVGKSVLGIWRREASPDA